MTELNDVYVITDGSAGGSVRGVFRDALDAMRAVHEEYGEPTTAVTLTGEDFADNVVYRQNVGQGTVQVKRHGLE